MKIALKSSLWLAAVLATAHATAGVVTIPDSALAASSGLYTSSFGSVVVTTGGGHANGAGDPSGRNDDGFSGPIALGYTLSNFFGHDYTQFWINNNGNVTFNEGVAAFTPEGPQGTNQPVIAPFFADVDTRGALSGVVHLNQSVVNQTVVTWDHVGYYAEHDDKLDSFQLVLRGPGFSVPAGEGQIGFFWDDMAWETGDASEGDGGFGGTPAAVGFGDGQQNGFVLQSSIHDGVSRVVAHKQIWFNLNTQGEPVPVPSVPEPQTYALMLAGLAVVGLMTRRRRR